MTDLVQENLVWWALNKILQEVYIGHTWGQPSLKISLRVIRILQSETQLQGIPVDTSEYK